MAHQGSWLGLPDFGVTEWLQNKVSPNKTYASSGGSNLVGRSSAQAPSYNSPGIQYGPAYNGPQGNVLGSQTGGGSYSHTGGGGYDRSNIDQNMNTGFDQVEADYQDFLNQLGGSEQGLQSQATNATQNVDTNYAPVRGAIEAEGSAKLAGLDTQTATAQGQEKTGMQGARDTFRQLQQQNIAQTSGLGISSSSVTEALAENLGVETARRIGSVAKTASDIYNAIAQEKTNVATYVKAKLTEMEGKIAQEKSNIQYSLMEGLRQINEARATAAKDKANRRADLLQSANNQIYTLQQNAQAFAQSLDQWKATNTAGLNATSNKDWNSIMAQGMNAISPFQSILGNQGLQAVPSWNSSGQMSVSTKKKDETDENLF